MGRVYGTWWPLAASWLLMSAEMPLLTAVVARLEQPKIQLAALGGILYAMALLIESPIIMLLAASTALCRNWKSYVWLKRRMHAMGLALTLLHVLVAFTPLYDFVVGVLLGSPEAIREPGRLGLQVMTPWTWAIAYRRFHQGVLIRNGHSRAVGLGTLVRLVANVAALGLGALLLRTHGVVVAGIGLSCGVLAEALYTGLRVRPVLRRLALNEDKDKDTDAALRGGGFWRFYLPLAVTSLLMLLAEPVGAAAMARMPRPLDSLAVWPVIFGLVWLAESLGMAYNEVMVALLDEPGMKPVLRRFAAWLAVGSLGVLALFGLLPPLWRFWMVTVARLPPELMELARGSFWLALPIPALVAVHSYYQGHLVNRGRTRGIPESVALFLLVASAVALGGVIWGRTPGILVVFCSLGVGALVQALWLWWRYRGWTGSAAGLAVSR